MKCPLCDSDAAILKKQILEFSIITFLQCSNKECNHKFITNIPTAAYPKKENSSRDEEKNDSKKSQHFHFLDMRQSEYL
jgi:hypothetical protein